MTRQCGSCTRCCDGWLTTNIYGFDVSENNPCIFKKKDGCGCEIYTARPQLCKDYVCGWLRDDGKLFDEWMKPDISNYILHHYILDGYEWYLVIPTGKSLSRTTISYLVQVAIRKNINLVYWVDGTQYAIGRESFRNYIVGRTESGSEAG